MINSGDDYDDDVISQLVITSCQLTGGKQGIQPVEAELGRDITSRLNAR